MNNNLTPIATPYPTDRSVHTLTTTQVLGVNDPGLAPAVVGAIQRGELVIIPTDTVYGVGTNAFDERAVRKLFVAKQRAQHKGIPILIADESDMDKITSEIPPLAQDLIFRFWPGPLTLILPKHEDLPPAISDSSGVAVRMPDHEVCRKIIRSAGGTLATTSANISGHAPANTLDAALNDLAGSVAIAVDAGPSGGQIASTVVDCTGITIRVLRAGPITMKDLVQVERL